MPRFVGVRLASHYQRLHLTFDCPLDLLQYFRSMKLAAYLQGGVGAPDIPSSLAPRWNVPLQVQLTQATPQHSCQSVDQKSVTYYTKLPPAAQEKILDSARLA